MDGHGTAHRRRAIAAGLVLLIAVGALAWYVRGAQEPSADAAHVSRLTITGSGPQNFFEELRRLVPAN